MKLNRQDIVAKLEKIKTSGNEWDLKFKKVRYVTEENRSFFAIFQSGTIIFKTEDTEWLIDEIQSILASNERHEMMLKKIDDHFDNITDEEFEENLRQAGFRKKDEFEELGTLVTNDGTLILEYDKINHSIDLISENLQDCVNQTLSTEDIKQLQDLLEIGLKRIEKSR